MAPGGGDIVAFSNDELLLLEEMLREAKAPQGRRPEHVSEPINRVLAAVRAKMKPGGE